MKQGQEQAHNFSFELQADTALEAQIGSNGLSQELIAEAKQQLSSAFNKLVADKDNIKLLEICDDDSQIKISQETAKEIASKYKKLIIYGIGGSSLGGQTLCGTRFYQYIKNQDTEIVFIDNIHYHNFNIFLEEINYQDTAFLTISKSGGTIETLSQILVTLDFFDGDIQQYGADNFYFVAETTKNPITQIANNLKRPIIPHHNKIGGRYSCFTPVAMIPAELTGINLNDYIAGGKAMVSDFLNNAENSLVFEGAAIMLAADKKGYPNHVFIPYLQRLYQMIYWYAQLFAESLGKNGKGMTPIKALGSVDQHSQLQLFLDGPKNKFFTFITQSTSSLGNKINIADGVENIDYLKGNTLGDVINANQEATIASLCEQGCPVRRIHFHEFDDRSLGEILMFFMLETILLGYAMDIDPFDQPAVEIGKTKAKKMLSRNQ